MDDVILLSQLNDFIFCPVSIYFHNLYGNMEKTLYQGHSQQAGTAAHKTIDEKRYCTAQNIITSLDVYCERYRLAGKIDMFDTKTGCLTERKKKIKAVYDGYVFQLYGQCFSLREMGYEVKELCLYSMDDNKKYPVLLPEETPSMLQMFEHLIEEMRNFTVEGYIQTNAKKCQNCIYEPACDRAVMNGECL